jgi:hypothetical protein
MGYTPSYLGPILCPVGVCKPGGGLNSTHFYLSGECYVANPQSALDVGSIVSCIGFSGEPHTGELYATVAGLVISGLALAVVVTALGLQSVFTMRPMKITILKLTPLLAIVAGALLLAAPLVLMIGQPSAFSMDTVTFGCGTAGPAQSFWGSCSGDDWGPDLGWIFSIGAAVAMFIGGVLFYRFGKSLLLHGQVVETEGSDKKSSPRTVDFPPDVT